MSRAAGPNGWALGGVLTIHFLLGFAWLVVFLGTVFLTSSYTGWADLVLLLGCFCWLVALPIIVIGWRSGSHWCWGVPVAWVTVFAIATVVVVEDAMSSFELRPVGATATFEESADCLVRYRKNLVGFGESRLDNDNVADCFPTQTASRKKTLIACFNKYEQNHPDNEGWPEDNMRGCAWDGLTAVPAPHVVRLAFGELVAVPAVPRAGKHFVLTVGVTRSDSGAKIVHTAIETEPELDIVVTIDGEEVVTADEELATTSFTDFEWGFFPDGKIHVSFTVPKTADGRRLMFKLRIAADTPAATKIATFTVGPS